MSSGIYCDVCGQRGDADDLAEVYVSHPFTRSARDCRAWHVHKLGRCIATPLAVILVKAGFVPEEKALP
jgi:hypothetical protein